MSNAFFVGGTDIIRPQNCGLGILKAKGLTLILTFKSEYYDTPGR